jgi:hypothetical protein
MLTAATSRTAALISYTDPRLVGGTTRLTYAGVAVDLGEPIVVHGTRHRGTMQWQLAINGAAAPVHIQVGQLPGNAWFVDHIGFGARRFTGKDSAWAAVQRLMTAHEGTWTVVPCNRRPWFVFRRSDGSRLLYDMSDDSLYDCWGSHGEKIWQRYSSAIHAGKAIRETTGHEPFNARYAVTEYSDPLDAIKRYSLELSSDEGSDYRVIDYPTFELATTRYEQTVRNRAKSRYPYRTSDVDGVPVDKHRRDPPGMRRVSSGEYVALSDLAEYERLYGRR